MNVKLYSWESQRTKWWIFHQLSWVSDSRRVPGCDSETQKPPASTTQPATKNLVLLYSSNRKKKRRKVESVTVLVRNHMFLYLFGAYIIIILWYFRVLGRIPCLTSCPLRGLSNAEYLHQLRDFIINCLVVDLPLWKNMSQLGWWHSQVNGKW